MTKLVERAMRATRQYSVMDFGCLKITVLSAGILVGASYPEFFADYTTLLWVIFIFSFLWIIYRTFVKHML